MHVINFTCSFLGHSKWLSVSLLGEKHYWFEKWLDFSWKPKNGMKKDKRDCSVVYHFWRESLTDCLLKGKVATCALNRTKPPLKNWACALRQLGLILSYDTRLSAKRGSVFAFSIFQSLLLKLLSLCTFSWHVRRCIRMSNTESYDPTKPPYAGFFGVMGASASIIFSCKWVLTGLTRGSMYAIGSSAGLFDARPFIQQLLLSSVLINNSRPRPLISTFLLFLLSPSPSLSLHHPHRSGCSLWHSQEWCGDRRHECNAARPHHEVCDPGCHGRYHCHLRPCRICTHC